MTAIVDTIKIGPIVYGISIVDDGDDISGAESGVVLNHSSEIKLAKSLSKQAARQALWKLVVYTVSLNCSLGLTEEQVSALGTGIHGVMVDNVSFR